MSINKSKVIHIQLSAHVGTFAPRELARKFTKQNWLFVVQWTFRSIAWEVCLWNARLCAFVDHGAECGLYF